MERNPNRTGWGVEFDELNDYRAPRDVTPVRRVAKEPWSFWISGGHDSLVRSLKFFMNAGEHNGDPDFAAYGTATDFLRAFVGNEWTNQTVFAPQPTRRRAIEPVMSKDGGVSGISPTG